MRTEIEARGVHVDQTFRRIILGLVGFSNLLLILGLYHGVMQALYRSGIIQKAGFLGLDYYQGLTLHGVINAVVWTTMVITALGYAIVIYYLREAISKLWSVVSFVLMILGTIMAAIPILAGKASVLYTFYAPLHASPLFYLGAALLIVGSWIAFFTWIPAAQRWKRKNPDQPLPLAVMGMFSAYIVWLVATIAVAIEVIFFLLPWSLGIIDTVSVPVTRLLFWFFGHPLVYFWLLPVYVILYTVLPKLVEGKLYSEDAARLVFLLFIVFSVPVGVHHQFTEPGLSQGVKFLQAFLTGVVAIPSLITAFTIAASLEYSVWRKEGRNSSLLGWLFKLPYFSREKYMVAYLMMGLLLFIFGGFTGVVNASFNLNLVVHNTSFIPGHFHLTVGGLVALGLMASSLYILETVGGRNLCCKGLALAVPYLWAIGMLTMSVPMMISGVLYGEPRRTNLGLTYLNPDSPLYNEGMAKLAPFVMAGGIILGIAAICYLIVFWGSLLRKPQYNSIAYFPSAEPFHRSLKWKWLRTFKPWLILLTILIAVAYVPALIDVLQTTYGGSLPFAPNSPLPIR